MQSIDEGSPPLLKVVDYFIHPSLQQDPDRQRRIRILILILLTFTAVVFLMLLAILIAPYPLESTIFGSVICAITTLGLLGILFKLRYQVGYLVASISTVVLNFTMIIAGISISGGPLRSPATQLLVVPLLTAYFFGGIRWGGWMVALSFATLLVFATLQGLGVTYVQTIEAPREFESLYFLVLFLNMSVIAGMAFIYEYTAASLKRERDDEQQRYVSLAKTDFLTGLSNRRTFENILIDRVAIYGALEPPRQFAVGFLDLDRFKPINDQYGHAVGDEVLCCVSNRLRNVLRGADFVGRQGGDEFMLILDLVADQTSFEVLAERLLQPFSQPVATSAGALSVGASLGFAVFPGDGTTADQLIRSADTAMYRAKQTHSGWHRNSRVTKTPIFH